MYGKWGQCNDMLNNFLFFYFFTLGWQIVMYYGNYSMRDIYRLSFQYVRIKDAFLSYRCSSSPEPNSDTLMSTNSGRFRGELFPSLQLSLKSATLTVHTL